MPTYTKLFNSIVTSTIWTEDDKTRLVWITMLAISDKNGEVHASIPGLARLAGVSVHDCENAISKLLSPDDYSRTPDFEGRRIEPIDGGWELLNHAKYRLMASKEDAKAATAARVKRHRARNADVTQCNGDVTDGNAPVTQSRDIADTEADTDTESAARFSRVRAEYNRRKQAEYRANRKKDVNDMSMTVNHNKQSPHSTEAEAEADTESAARSSRVRAGEAARAADGFAETKTTAGHMLEIEKRVQSLRPGWRIPLTYAEQQALRDNARCLDGMADDDWTLIADYLHAKLPDGSPGWQPRSRTKFLESISDVFTYATEWRRKQEARRPTATTAPPLKKFVPVDGDTLAEVFGEKRKATG
jgi:chemotaxis protein histidine kinase CheA